MRLPDFDDLAAYRAFVDEIASRHNAGQLTRIKTEQAYLQAMPECRLGNSEEVCVIVSPLQLRTESTLFKSHNTSDPHCTYHWLARPVWSFSSTRIV